MNVKDPSSRLVRWKIQLEEFHFKILHKVGNVNVNVDVISRYPIVKKMQKTKVLKKKYTAALFLETKAFRKLTKS